MHPSNIMNVFIAMLGFSVIIESKAGISISLGVIFLAANELGIMITREPVKQNIRYDPAADSLYDPYL